MAAMSNSGFRRDPLFADRIETRRTVTFDPATNGIAALRERRLGAVRLSSGPDSDADPDAIAAAFTWAAYDVHRYLTMPQIASAKIRT